MVRLTIHAPFRALDPGLRDAEALLESARVTREPDDPVLSSVRRMLGALPNGSAAARHLDFALTASGARPQIRDRHGRPYFSFTSSQPQRSSRHAQALSMLAVLVAVDGWRRIRTCDRCQRPYVDRTNGVTRRRCADHVAHRPASPEGGRSQRPSITE